MSCGRPSWIWVPTVLPGSCEVTGRRVNLEPLFPFGESGMVGGTLGSLRVKCSELTLQVVTRLPRVEGSQKLCLSLLKHS